MTPVGWTITGLVIQLAGTVLTGITIYRVAVNRRLDTAEYVQGAKWVLVALATMAVGTIFQIIGARG
jgi:hypothetical protein